MDARSPEARRSWGYAVRHSSLIYSSAPNEMFSATEWSLEFGRALQTGSDSGLFTGNRRSSRKRLRYSMPPEWSELGVGSTISIENTSPSGILRGGSHKIGRALPNGVRQTSFN